MSSFIATPLIDEPVFVFHKNPIGICGDYPTIRSVKSKGEVSFEKHMDMVFAWDDKDELVKAFKDLTVPTDENGDIRGRLFRNMYGFDAVKCASEILYNHHGIFKFDIEDTAVGKVKYRNPFPFPFPNKISTPLHEAARTGALHIIRLLLHAHRSPNLRVHYVDHNLYPIHNIRDALPLHVAISELGDDSYLEWAKKKSIFKLIARLCHPSLANRVETVRLLARKITGLDQEFFRYMKDGKLVEMCVLLLAGCRPPSPSLVQCRDDIPEKEKILELFEVFRTMGDKLSGYIRIKRSKFLKLDRVTSEIASLFEDSGFLVKCEDIPSMYDNSPRNYSIPPTSDSKKISVPRLVSPCAPALALGGLSFTNKGSAPMHGVQQFHNISIPKAMPCVHVKNQVISGDVNHQLCKHRACSYFTRALRRGGRLV